MANQLASANAGVYTASGIEFQKHCALDILLDKYAAISSRKYFICIEHHDDFLFGYESPTNTIEFIEAYQAKRSSNP